MPTAPCKNCEHKGCGVYHSKCEKYLKFKAECEEVRKKHYQERDLEEYRRNCVKCKKNRH